MATPSENFWNVDKLEASNSNTRLQPIKSAVLLILFNRPELTEKVFNRIRTAEPPRLYLSFDGPRAGNTTDSEKIEMVKDLASKADWPCDVKTLIHEVNQGCGPAVKMAIDWFFSHETEGLIFEDDTLPDPSFFSFAEALLEKYRWDTRVGMIAGTNHLPNLQVTDSYLFSRNKACWGWATWRRAWAGMDFAMEWRTSAHAPAILENMGISRGHKNHWKKALKQIDAGAVSAWDWQWYFSLAAQNQLTIFPASNLIANIGFGPQATHTTGVAKLTWTRTEPLAFPLKHPSFTVPNAGWDFEFERTKFSAQLGSRLLRQSKRALKGVRWLNR